MFVQVLRRRILRTIGLILVALFFEVTNHFALATIVSRCGVGGRWSR
jgi:hypothetical protein